MVVVLGFMVLLVPIMRLKDYLSKEGIGFHGLLSKIKNFDFNTLKSLSWSQVVTYLQGLTSVPDSHLGFEVFQVEDSQESFEIYAVIEKYLGIIWHKLSLHIGI